LPGEAGTLHPGNLKRAAGQNPDVKERSRTPHRKPHPPPARQRHCRPARGKPQTEPAEQYV